MTYKQFKSTAKGIIHAEEYLNMLGTATADMGSTTLLFIANKAYDLNEARENDGEVYKEIASKIYRG